MPRGGCRADSGQDVRSDTKTGSAGKFKPSGPVGKGQGGEYPGPGPARLPGAARTARTGFPAAVQRAAFQGLLVAVRGVAPGRQPRGQLQFQLLDQQSGLSVGVVREA